MLKGRMGGKCCGMGIKERVVSDEDQKSLFIGLPYLSFPDSRTVSPGRD